MSYILKYRLKELRKEKGIKMVTLLTLCQVTEMTIRRWEVIAINEDYSIPSDQLKKIADFFGLSMEDMYTENLAYEKV